MGLLGHLYASGHGTDVSGSSAGAGRSRPLPPAFWKLPGTGGSRFGLFVDTFPVVAPRPLFTRSLEMMLSMEGRIGFGRQADFLVLAASWFAFGSLFQSAHTPPGIFLAWVLLTTALLIILLDGSGYFDRYTPQPELSGVLSLLLAVTFSAFFSRWLITWVGKTSFIPYAETLRASIWVAMAFELSQWVIFKVHCTTGRRWVLATCILPEELEGLRSQVAQSDSSEWITIQPINRTGANPVPLQGHETLVISRGAVHHLKNHPEFLMAHLRGQRIVDINQLLKEFRCRLNLRNADAWTFLLGSIHQSFLIRLYFNINALM